MKLVLLLLAVVAVALIVSFVRTGAKYRAVMQGGDPIAEFEVHHLPGLKKLFLSLKPRDEEAAPVIWFLHYLARQVSACSPDLGERLWRELFEVSSEHWERINSGELDDLDVAIPDDAWEVTTTLGEVQDTVLFHGSVFFTDGISMLDQRIPMLGNDTLEHVSYEGTRAIYYHLMKRGSRQTKFLLPVGLMRLCNWYREHGWSGPMKEHGATQDAGALVWSMVRANQERHRSDG